MKTSDRTKAIGYCRVSSKEQEDTGYSLPSQQKLLKDYSERKNNNFNIIKIFSIAESASGKKQRRVFSEMLDYSRKNKINILLVEKVDRLTRNLKEAVAVNDWLEENAERELHFVKTNLVIHQNSKSDEKFRWDIEIVLAKKFIANLSEEVHKGQKEKLSQGWIPKSPYTGYKTIGEKGHKIHIVDKDKAPLVIKVFELYNTGNHSLKSLREEMLKMGLTNTLGKPVSRNNLHSILKNPFYCGKILWKGEIYNNTKHEPLISEELFDSVQEKLLRKKDAPQFKKHNPVFKAKIRCEECGGLISWYFKRNNWYGNCNHYKKCSQRGCARQDRVEEKLFPHFDKVAPKNERVLKWIEKALKESHSQEIDLYESQRKQLNRIIGIADSRMANAYKDKLDGKVPINLYEKIMRDSEEEKKQAEDSLKKLGEDKTKYYQAGYSIHELALNAKRIYQSKEATIEQKRLLLSKIFTNIALSADEIKPNYTLAFKFLHNQIPALNSTFEHQENCTNKRQEALSDTACPVMLRG